jgi:hypothetical protein
MLPLPSIANATLPVGVPVPGAFTATVTVIVTNWPNVDGFGDDMIIVVVPASLTVCIKLPLLVWYTLPAAGVYVAVIVCGPMASVEVVLLVAVPAALRVTAPPNGVPSIANCTVPAGVPSPRPDCWGATVAVKYTPWPNTDGFTPDVTVVIVAALNTLSVAGVGVLLLT